MRSLLRSVLSSLSILLLLVYNTANAFALFDQSITVGSHGSTYTAWSLRRCTAAGA